MLALRENFDLANLSLPGETGETNLPGDPNVKVKAEGY